MQLVKVIKIEMKMTAPLPLLFSQPSVHPWGESGGRYLRRVERVYSRI